MRHPGVMLLKKSEPGMAKWQANELRMERQLHKKKR